MTRKVFIMRRLIFIISLIILFISSSLIGVLDIRLKSLLMLDKEAWNNFLYFRIPRTVSIVLSASGLSVAGLIMQSVSKNKFISPTTGGTISASQLGLLIGLLMFGSFTIYVRFIFAFLFSLIFSILFIIILSRIKIKNIIYIPLIGMMYGGIISSLTMFIAGLTNTLQTVQTWNVGSFTLLVKGRYELLYLILVPVVLSIIYATKFSIVGMGEDFSRNLGINYKRTVFLGLFLVSIISAVTYITVGPLPFLGLIIPNIITMYYGDNLKNSLFDMIALSSIYILICDIIARLIRYPYEIPISLISGLIGSVVFLILLFRRTSNG